LFPCIIAQFLTNGAYLSVLAFRLFSKGVVSETASVFYTPDNPGSYHQLFFFHELDVGQQAQRTQKHQDSCSHRTKQDGDAQLHYNRTQPHWIAA